MDSVLNVDQKYRKLARRLYYLPPGRYFAVVTNRPTGLDWTIKQTGNGEHHPARLKETVIEDALPGLRFGRYFWVVHVTPARMSIEGRRVGRVEW